MKRGKSRIVTAILFSLMSHAVQAGPQPIQSPSEGIVETGQQISQVRFMLEVYSVIGTGIKYHDPRKRLNESIETFEQTLANLEKVNDPEIQKAATKAQEAWKPVKKALMSAFEKRDPEAMKKDALTVHADIRAVIVELEKIKELFLKQAEFAHAKEINAAIEVAASARRLSSHYMMKMWNLPDPTIDKHWNNGMEKYKKALEILESSPVGKDPNVAPKLKVCKKEYTFFETIIGFGDNYVPVLVQKHAQKAYKTANEIVKYLLEKDKKK